MLKRELLTAIVLAISVGSFLGAPARAQDPAGPDCPSACKLAFEPEVQACLAQGGSPDACWQDFEAKVMACLADCPQPPPPPPPLTCAEQCEAQRDAYISKCALPDGTVDPNCLADVDARIQDCILACENPPPPPATCEDRCSALKAQMLERCTLPDGTVDPNCLAEIERTIQSCWANCVEPPPPVPACDERCSQLKVELLSRCTSADGTVEEACLAEAEKLVEGCYAACSGPQPPPEPTCDERCRLGAEEALAACLAGDDPDADCKARYEEALQSCLAADCPPAPPPERSCTDACAARAREVFDLCAKEGSPDSDCQAKAAEALRQCALECTGTPPVDEQVPCDQDCVERSESIFRTCMAAGGSEEDCRARSDAILGLCLERCSGQVPCESGCALAAQVVLMGLSMAGMPDEQARGFANVVLAQCVGSCRPTSTCADRCEMLAASAVRECMARGGTEDECAVKGDEVRVACDAACNGAPVPTCDAQCQEKADLLREEWLAEGLAPEEVAARQERFLEECQSLLGESCVEEAKADLTVFQSFRRGDSNRDGRVDITDGIAILRTLFQGGSALPCEDAADANDDGRIDISDSISILGTLFLGAQGVAEPFGEPGQDPTSDSLVCEH